MSFNKGIFLFPIFIDYHQSDRCLAREKQEPDEVVNNDLNYIDAFKFPFGCLLTTTVIYAVSKDNKLKQK